MRLNDIQSFTNFHRMDPETFDELLAILGPCDKNLPNRINEEITLNERLAVTLRYLASGDSMKSVGYYGFRIGASTTSNIIRDTCALIWEKLHFVFPTPSEELWKTIADDFEEQWGFPNCLGAIDGKHVVVQTFNNHNSLTFNYKNSHSLILMAVADANYKFVMVDIGALGHNSDGGVFRSSRFGNYILNHPEELHIPDARNLPNCSVEAPFTFVFIADEASSLRKYIMRPYPGRNITTLPPHEHIFNKRLSRARRVVENAFGILASRFRILRKPIIASKETTLNIVQATVCLHNWLRDHSKSGHIDFELDNELSINTPESSNNGSMLPLTSTHANHASRDAIKVRELYTKYFIENNYN